MNRERFVVALGALMIVAIAVTGIVYMVVAKVTGTGKGGGNGGGVGDFNISGPAGLVAAVFPPPARADQNTAPNYR